MPLYAYFGVLLFFVTHFGPVNGQHTGEDVNFPTDDEIRLVLTQAGRAIEQYKPLLDQEQKMLGKEGSEAVSKDREVVAGLELAIKSFGKSPQAFNGPLGFNFFEMLDDASRNAVLCGSNAMNKAFESAVDGQKDKAMSELHLAQSCTDVSTLLYTVSENAGALYARYVGSEQKLAEEGAQVAQRCVEILKQNGAISNQK
jgi:hypothetical protein